MENVINFYFLGDYDQAMAAALKLIPLTANDREIKIVRASEGYDHHLPSNRVTVKFTNNHKYAAITSAADIFDNELTEEGK